ncbi:GspE/PulE family protein [Patescibacteria group bacterium]|nr:GspE/PulE family protein [Patescibacteria group bacterium]
MNINQSPGLSGDDLQEHQTTLNSDKSLMTNKVVDDIKRKQEEKATHKLAEKLSLPYLNLMNYQPEPGVVNIVPKELVKSGNVFAFKKKQHSVYLAISDPANPHTIEVLKKLQALDQYTFIPVLVSGSTMKYLVAVYDIFAPKERPRNEEINITEDAQKQSTATFKNWQSGNTKLEQAALTDLFSTILANATYTEASDIHIEPTKEAVHLRFRLDGMLQDVATLPISTLSSLISRIKLLSSLKLNLTDSAQDGRFSLRAGKIGYDMRVSILPTAHGESAVMRLLPQEGKFITLEELGLTSHYNKVVESIIRQPNGLILNTGPTGSGKTTTLYAILNKINSPNKKIITLEDPVEYHLAGITQSQVNPDENYTFATGLRAILRQDPDVILVGEIRDGETANIAINASLTGHLVLSTLHTNDAAGAIPRLADLGLKPDYFIEAILAVIAQRLVRKLCTDCVEEYKPTESELSEIKSELDALPPQITKPALPLVLKRPNLDKMKTCELCHGTGFKGRLGIFEILEPKENIVKAVLGGVTIGEIKKMAMANGMITLKQDGIFKVISGLTTLEEVIRVTGENTD